MERKVSRTAVRAKDAVIGARRRPAICAALKPEVMRYLAGGNDQAEAVTADQQEQHHEERQKSAGSSSHVQKSNCYLLLSINGMYVSGNKRYGPRSARPGPSPRRQWLSSAAPETESGNRTR